VTIRPTGSAASNQEENTMPKDQALDGAFRASVGRPCALALAVCVALGLSACGGGGSNVKVNLPSTPPPSGGGTSTPNTMTVAPGQSVATQVVLEGGMSLDNQGTIGGSVDIAVEAKTASTIANHGGGIIRAGKTAVRLDHGGSIDNGAGSTIEATSTGGSDCGAAVLCAIYVGPNTTAAAGAVDFTLVNAGTIIGNVRMDEAGRNEVALVAGGSIHGDLDIGSGDGASLSLGGGAGTLQRYSDAVTGATLFQGALAKTGTGTWIIDGDWGHPERVDLNGGVLRIVDGGPSTLSTPTPGVPLVVQLRHGELVFDQSGDVFLDAVVRSDRTLGEDGVLVQAGTGTLLLGTWDGLPDLRIERGTLQIGNNGEEPPITVVADSYANAENDGALVFDNNIGIFWHGDMAGTGSLALQGGALMLMGTNTYTGGTTVDRGYLWVDYELPGDVAVNAEGHLQASAISGDLYNAGGVDAQGEGRSGSQNLPGLAVAGDYHQAATGTLIVELGHKLDVAGTATLDGGTLEVDGAAAGYVANTHTEVLAAAGGVTGTFDQLVKRAGVVFTSTSIHYDAGSVWLDTTGLDITTAAAGGGIGYTPVSMNSAKRVQGAFEQLDERIATGTLAGVSGDFLHAAGRFQRAPSIEAAQASLRSLSGELHAASAAMTFRAIDAGNQALSDHLDGVRDGRASLGMWTRQLGSGGGMARNGFDGVGFQLDGWLVGNDFRVGRSGVVGVAFGQGQGLQQLQGGFDRDRSRRSEGMVYAGIAGDRWYAQGRLGFGQFRQDVSRALLLGDGAEGVWTRYSGRYQVAYGETGLRYGFGDLRVAPFASVQYARSSRDAFAEEGAGGFGLRSDAQSQARWQASVGVRASRGWRFGNDRALDLGAHAQWFRASGTAGDAMDASFVGLQQWSPLLGIGLSRYGALFGVGLDARLSSNAMLKLGYDYEHGQFDDAHGMAAGLKLAF
jgi:fibronectin-binding autotransporter adhesin